MIIDSSALLAVMQAEPEAAAVAAAIETDALRLLSAASLLETSIVIEARYGANGGRQLDRLLTAAAIEVTPVSVAQAQLAREAWRRYGKGRHAASLNFGDCFSYALAKDSGEPLLCIGQDFNKTDIELVPL